MQYIKEEENPLKDFKLYCTATSGMENLTKLEFQEKFPSSVGSLEVLPGKVFFTFLTNEYQLFHNLLHELKSVEHVYLILFSFEIPKLKQPSKTPSDPQKQLLASLEENFMFYFHQYKKFIVDFFQIYKEINGKTTQSLLKFRVDAKENLIPKQIKNDLTKRIAEFLVLNIENIDADISEFDMKLTLEKIVQRCYFSVKLTINGPLGLAQVSKFREKTYATMRPSIAYNLCRLLSIEDGDYIIDPMCGSGTLIEIAIKEYKKSAYYIGADIDVKSISKTQKNLENLKFGTYDLILCNSKKSPFRSGIFNKLLTDLPFGKRCGSSQENWKLYPLLAKEFHRMMEINGKAILVSTEKALLHTNFKKSKGFKKQDFFMINKGGLETCVAVLKKFEMTRRKKENQQHEEKKLE